MGYLTPILISNDAAHLLKDKHLQKQICESLWRATADNKQKDIPIHFDAGGVHCNPIESLGTAHANVNRVVVIHGNTWIDLSREVWNDLDEEHLDYIEDCMRIAERDIKDLKKKIKAAREKES